jgi:hypothetical protein
MFGANKQNPHGARSDAFCFLVLYTLHMLRLATIAGLLLTACSVSTTTAHAPECKLDMEIAGPARLHVKTPCWKGDNWYLYITGWRRDPNCKVVILSIERMDYNVFHAHTMCGMHESTLEFRMEHRMKGPTLGAYNVENY